MVSANNGPDARTFSELRSDIDASQRRGEAYNLAFDIPFVATEGTLRKLLDCTLKADPNARCGIVEAASIAERMLDAAGLDPKRVFAGQLSNKRFCKNSHDAEDVTESSGAAPPLWMGAIRAAATSTPELRGLDETEVCRVLNACCKVIL